MGFVPAAEAHDLVVRTELSGRAVIVQGDYAGESPVRDAEVRVFESNTEISPTLVGRTDRNGVFSFVPDVAGEWVVIVDDGYGHYAESRITIDEDGAATSNGSGRLSTWLQMLVGVSVIFGITGLWHWRKAASGRPGR
jgi:nickel transport protein